LQLNGSFLSSGFNDAEVALYRIEKEREGKKKNIEMPTPNTLISYGI
jgi:hypothetical protein